MRLDVYLVEHLFVSTRSKANDLIKREQVYVNDVVVTKSGYEIKDNDSIHIIETPRYVSRAGEKLKDAIDAFKVDFKDRTVIDVGSSTGGFTDCALQCGACKVYAYDVGLDQFDQTLKHDSRIELFEGTNILSVSIPRADIILIDVSFTSVIPIIKHLNNGFSEFLVLIKPQFEAGNIFFKGGILKDKRIHLEIINNIMNLVEVLGYIPYAFKESKIKGKSGNQEYLLYFGKTKKNKVDMNYIKEIINNA